jgi:hypothetical protein
MAEQMNRTIVLKRWLFTKMLRQNEGQTTYQGASAPAHGDSVFAYPKRECYCFNTFCFEIARQITLSNELSGQPELARFFKTESSDIVVFCFGISETTMFSNAIDSVSFGI